jgi:arsenate reductase (glutaredoxin)
MVESTICYTRAPAAAEVSAMLDVTIYHNPRCSKSRETLLLLEHHGVIPNIVLYMDTPPKVSELRKLLSKLGLEAADLLRAKEGRELGLDRDTPAAELRKAMAHNPRLIERPIVVCGDRAVLGRPPERVLALLA